MDVLAVDTERHQHGKTSSLLRSIDVGAKTVPVAHWNQRILLDKHSKPSSRAIRDLVNRTAHPRMRQTNHLVSLATAPLASSRIARSALANSKKWPPTAATRRKSIAHNFSRRRALPDAIFSRSASLSDVLLSHCVPLALDANGQSTENMTRSIPISWMEHCKALSEKKPLVVTWKCEQNTSRKFFIGVSRESASSILARVYGMVSPRWPRIS